MAFDSRKQGVIPILNDTNLDLKILGKVSNLSFIEAKT